jgi:hypothetical protein
MPSLRSFALTLAPLVIVGAVYRLTLWETPAIQGAVLLPDVELMPALPAPANSGQELSAACEHVARELRKHLNPDCRVIVRVPFVLGGDLPESELDRYHAETIVPTARALSVAYVDREPNQPITLLLFAVEASYHEHAQRLDGRRVVDYHGYYEREQRRALLNIATGAGTLAHELTHAWVHSDFERMPEWFDEGLAALHEESEFSADGLQLIGHVNWRLYYLLEALAADQLEPLAGLVALGKVRGGHEAVDYAHARYVCLYLQQRGLLPAFYRKFRSSVDTDPTGERTLCRLLNVDSLAEVDDDFREWILSLQPANLPSGRASASN